MPVPSVMSKRMTLVEALEVLHAVRRGEVVVTTMGNAREWQKLGKDALDLIYVPSSMGQGTSIALGIALAQPDRKVVVCNGDGSMLMNLGSLVTISAQAPANLTVIVFDNGVYEVTGAQPTAAAPALRPNSAPVDFAALARASGFTRVYTFDAVEPWRNAVGEILNGTGPTFVQLRVEPVADGGLPAFPGPAPDRAVALRAALRRAE
ncbi:MAG TPA: thiamine pyrophosphate-dependent enzyme [Planctomycetaceae bacterium]|jgi:sulfopyruvate decarboxylase subunit beta|nr:thiamine pyrophosphate-dependent enzyme [Planctomycetaceae bacterium]